MIENYRDLDALGLAELIRNGETTALEVLECAMAAAQARNGDINAVTAYFEDAAAV